MKILVQAFTTLLLLAWSTGASTAPTVPMNDEAPASGAPAKSPGPAQRFRCESDSSRQHYCAIDTDQGVTLVKQLSRVPCKQGRTWDYDRHGVWVSHRCGAEFVVGTPVEPDSRPQDRLLRCESRDDRIERCPVDTSGGVKLVRKFSVSDCVENQDWGYDRDAVWVTQGCRAEFSVSTGDAAASGDSLVCESEGETRKHCAVAVGKRVDLLRQLSKTRCVQGTNWGWDADGIWVDQGCRAEFTVR